ncbi:MAG TPA: glycosyltransferase family 2 protein [Candidatus Sulfotelmatobacter sp.]|nr:glycosyltransferase family 2 protein [Candidatus Sulfotelmatobacter sp.]
MPTQKSASTDVSVIVPCRNEIREIRAFLDCILRQELGELEMEVLIADGMSDDGTRAVLDEFRTGFENLRVLDNPEKIVSTGLNRAIREASGEIIIRMDAHTLYAADYVRTCVEVLNETGAGNVGGPALTRAEGYIAEAIAHGFHAPFASGGAKYRDPKYEGSVDTVSYGCWRKSTLELIGLFDEHMVRGEDDDLNRRLASHGGIVWQSPRIVSWYRPRDGLRALFWQHLQYGFWKVPIVWKHRGRPTWRNFAPVSCLAVAAILLSCAVVADATGSASLRNSVLVALLALACLYLAGSLGSAFVVAKRNGWKFLPFMPIVFGVFHVSYALGFSLGLAFPPRPWDQPNPIQRALTAITR